MTNEDHELDGLFQRYRDSFPEFQASPEFMPRLWEKIENRPNFWSVFQSCARAAMSLCAVLCLLLLVLNFMEARQNYLPDPTYADALAAEHTAEKTYYTEAIRSTPDSDRAVVGIH